MDLSSFPKILPLILSDLTQSLKQSSHFIKTNHQGKSSAEEEEGRRGHLLKSWL